MELEGVGIYGRDIHSYDTNYVINALDFHTKWKWKNYSLNQKLIKLNKNYMQLVMRRAFNWKGIDAAMILMA